MQILKLTRTLKLSTNALWQHYQKYASKQGRDYLLFLPDVPEGVDPIKNRVVLVAHADTYHETPYTYTYQDKSHTVYPKVATDKKVFFDKRGVFWSPDGLGADDRAGIYAVMRLFTMLRGTDAQPIVLITNGEESGGRGASEAARHAFELANCNYLIELDRQGTREAVFYNDESDEFVQHVCSFGFTKEIGSFSDISILAPAWKICATNLSCGYVDEHTKYEHLYLTALQRTIHRVMLMLQDNAAKPKQYTNYVAATSSYDRWYEEWDIRTDADTDEREAQSWYRKDAERDRDESVGDYLVKCRQCLKLVDIGVHWEADCPYCGTPLQP